METKIQTLLKSELRNHFGHCNMTKIKRYLKSKATNQYGCDYYEETTSEGIKLSYTSNYNCFARYLIGYGKCGIYTQLALTSKDITKSGHIRGCSSYYAFK